MGDSSFLEEDSGKSILPCWRFPLRPRDRYWCTPSCVTPVCRVSNTRVTNSCGGPQGRGGGFQEAHCAGRPRKIGITTIGGQSWSFQYYWLCLSTLLDYGWMRTEEDEWCDPLDLHDDKLRVTTFVRIGVARWSRHHISFSSAPMARIRMAYIPKMILQY